VRAFRPLLRDDGVSSHEIDLRDHLAGRLEHLRFAESIWESPLFADSGFYTNRLRMSEIVAICERAGFVATSIVHRTWAEVPTPRTRMDAAFRGFADEDLKVQDFTLLLVPADREDPARTPA